MQVLIISFVPIHHTGPPAAPRKTRSFLLSISIMVPSGKLLHARCSLEPSVCAHSWSAERKIHNLQMLSLHERKASTSASSKSIAHINLPTSLQRRIRQTLNQTRGRALLATRRASRYCYRHRLVKSWSYAPQSFLLPVPHAPSHSVLRSTLTTEKLDRPMEEMNGSVGGSVDRSGYLCTFPADSRKYLLYKPRRLLGPNDSLSRHTITATVAVHQMSCVVSKWSSAIYTRVVRPA